MKVTCVKVTCVKVTCVKVTACEGDECEGDSVRVVNEGGSTNGDGDVLQVRVLGGSFWFVFRFSWRGHFFLLVDVLAQP